MSCRSCSEGVTINVALSLEEGLPKSCDALFALAELESVIPLVRSSVAPTPQYAWPLLKARTGVDVVVKHENHTPIGSFKVRGGLIYFDRLKCRRPQVPGIVTATRGNHGQSLAFAGSRAGIAVTIVVRSIVTLALLVVVLLLRHPF